MWSKTSNLDIRTSHVDGAAAKWSLAWVVDRDETGKTGEGANFVDITLKVIVRGKPGMMFAFKPQYPHAASVCNGIVSSGLAIHISTRVQRAFDEFFDTYGEMPQVFAFEPEFDYSHDVDNEQEE